MTLYWLHQGWTDATCPRCGAKIWPDGDPDWGLCYDCFSAKQRADRERYKEEPYACDICGEHEAVTSTNGLAVCSEECNQEALRRTKETL